MELIGTILFALAASLLFNFLFALLYILSKSVLAIVGFIVFGYIEDNR